MITNILFPSDENKVSAIPPSSKIYRTEEDAVKATTGHTRKVRPGKAAEITGSLPTESELRTPLLISNYHRYLLFVFPVGD